MARSMVKARRRLPAPVIVVTALLVGCSGKVKVSCGGSSSDKAEGGTIEANMSGIALVTKSTHPDIKPDMRCKVVIEKTADKELADARVSCFESDPKDGIVVYSGSSATIKYEPRTDSKADDRILYIDESAKVRARIELDRTKTPPGTAVVWSTDPAWEIQSEAPAKAPR